MPARAGGSSVSVELYGSGEPFGAEQRVAAELCAAQAALVLRAFGGGGDVSSLAHPALELAGEALAVALEEEDAAAEVVRLAAGVAGAAAAVLWERRDESFVPATSWGIDPAAISRPAREVAERALAEPGPTLRRSPSSLRTARPRPPCPSAARRSGAPAVPSRGRGAGRGAARAAGDVRCPCRTCAADGRAGSPPRARARADAGAARGHRPGDGRALGLAHAGDRRRAGCGAAGGGSRGRLSLGRERRRARGGGEPQPGRPALARRRPLLDVALGPSRDGAVARGRRRRGGPAARARRRTRRGRPESARLSQFRSRREATSSGFSPRIRRGGRPPGEHETALLAALAGQLAIAVQNAQLHEQATLLGEEREAALAAERAAARQIRALYEVSRSFAQSLRLDETLDALARTVVEVLDLDAAVVRMPDERREQLVPHAVHIRDAPFADAVRTILTQPVPFGQRNVQRLFRDRRAFRLGPGAAATSSTCRRSSRSSRRAGRRPSFPSPCRPKSSPRSASSPSARAARSRRRRSRRPPRSPPRPPSRSTTPACTSSRSSSPTRCSARCCRVPAP